MSQNNMGVLRVLFGSKPGEAGYRIGAVGSQLQKDTRKSAVRMSFTTTKSMSTRLGVIGRKLNVTPDWIVRAAIRSAMPKLYAMAPKREYNKKGKKNRSKGYCCPHCCR